VSLVLRPVHSLLHVSIANLLGYDSVILHRLDPAQQAAIAWLAAGWLLSCALLAAPLVYVARLITHELILALGVGAASVALLLALLRLLVAGGSAPRSAVQSARGPALLMGLLGVLFAQPAQLPLLRDELTAPVALRRATLLAQHRASASTAEPAQAQASAAAYRKQLAHCEFVVLRLQHVWSEPARALRYTLLYCCLVLLPSWLARSSAYEALRRYQRLHAREQQLSVMRAARLAQAAIDTLLAAYPTYQLAGDRTALRNGWLSARVAERAHSAGAEP
jgi:hypothetical protein